jgi:hemolysin activation/secretion protein
MKYALQAVFVLGVMAVVADPALAQKTPPKTPPRNRPGRVEQDTRLPPQPKRSEGIRIDAPRLPDQMPEGAQAARFTLGAVVLVGNRAVPTERLARIWAADVGQPISLADAFRYAAAVSAAYREAGYILSQAVIPVQELSTVSAATLRIDVLEGHIDQVRVVGLGAAPSARVKAMLARVQAERPLRLATLERSLLLINELPGVSAQATLKPGGAHGSSDLEISAANTPREYSLAMHNRSPPAQGKTRIELGADFRGGLTGVDRHSWHWAGSSDKRLNLLSYNGELPLGADGLKLQLAASGSRLDPGAASLNVDTNSRNASLGVAYPWLRSRATNVALRAQYGGYHNVADSGAGKLSESRIRAFRFGLTADHADQRGGLSLLDVELSQGLARWGASSADDPLMNGAKPNFNKLTAYAARQQSLGGAWSLLGALTLQHSGDVLPTAEQLGLGGDTFVRAFDASEAIGENGVAGKLELRYNLTLRSLPSTVYAYYDAGQVTRKGADASTPDVRTALHATGLGLRLSGPYRSKGYLELAQPHEVVASQGNKKLRVFAGLGLDF